MPKLKSKKRNKNESCVCSPKYGSMTFWKNKDFWQAMLMYAGGVVILLTMLKCCAKTM